MIELFLLYLFSAGCPETIIETKDNLTWTDKDNRMIGAAKAGCTHYYGADACLIRLIKTKENSYYAICRKVNSSSAFEFTLSVIEPVVTELPESK